MATTLTVAERLHEQARAANLREMAGLLREVLTARLAAYTLGLKEADAVVRWSTGELSEIADPAVERRLRAAYEVVSLLLTIDSPPTIQSWFIGMNDLLNDAAPAEAIRDGRFDDALLAATAVVAYG